MSRSKAPWRLRKSALPRPLQHVVPQPDVNADLVSLIVPYRQRTQDISALRAVTKYWTRKLLAPTKKGRNNAAVDSVSTRARCQCASHLCTRSPHQNEARPVGSCVPEFARIRVCKMKLSSVCNKNRHGTRRRTPRCRTTGVRTVRVAHGAAFAALLSQGSVCPSQLRRPRPPQTNAK